MNELIKAAWDLYEKNKDLPMKERWDLPFPMAVFGTLRENQGNNYLMHRGKIEKHCKTFMPRFIARGLSLYFLEGGSAPCEVFFYSAEEWKKMIGRVDSLEGCTSKPQSEEERNKKWGYYRTLAHLHVLPDDFKHPLFDGYTLFGSADRNIKIPQEEWAKYPTVPCWVYSNISSNNAAIEKKTSTIIWG